MTTALADKLQVWGFEKDFTIFADGSCGFGLELNPIDVSCWNDERVNNLSVSIGQFLNGLRVGLDLQFVQEISSNDNEKILQQHEALARETSNECTKVVTGKRVERLRLLDKQMCIRDRNSNSLQHLQSSD